MLIFRIPPCRLANCAKKYWDASSLSAKFPLYNDFVLCSYVSFCSNFIDSFSIIWNIRQQFLLLWFQIIKLLFRFLWFYFSCAFSGRWSYQQNRVRKFAAFLIILSVFSIFLFCLALSQVVLCDLIFTFVAVFPHRANACFIVVISLLSRNLPRKYRSLFWIRNFCDCLWLPAKSWPVMCLRRRKVPPHEKEKK